jgi:hypothetical protein
VGSARATILGISITNQSKCSLAQNVGVAVSFERIVPRRSALTLHPKRTPKLHATFRCRLPFSSFISLEMHRVQNL